MEDKTRESKIRDQVNNAIAEHMESTLIVTNRYSFDELWDILEDVYKFEEEFAVLLAKSLSYLPRDDAREVLQRAFFIPAYREAGSWHFSQTLLIKGRDVIVLHEEDLSPEIDAIVTILHEAGHAFLGHQSNTLQRYEADYRRDEDECWNQVRKWLPSEFSDCIDRWERLGGGSKGGAARP